MLKTIYLKKKFTHPQTENSGDCWRIANPSLPYEYNLYGAMDLDAVRHGFVQMLLFKNIDNALKINSREIQEATKVIYFEYTARELYEIIKPPIPGKITYTYPEIESLLLNQPLPELLYDKVMQNDYFKDAERITDGTLNLIVT